MPTGAEDHRHLGTGLLDHRLDVDVPVHALGVGVVGELAETQAERLVVRMGELLIPEEDHLVPKQRVLDLSELSIGEQGQVDTLHFGAHRGSELLDDNVLVVLEPCCRSDPSDG